MSVFSEQVARLASGLANAKTAIEGKGGTVTVSNVTPQIEEIVTGIGTIETGGTSSYIYGVEACGDLVQGLVNGNITLTRNITVTTITKT
jgi:hypothetical protein